MNRIKTSQYIEDNFILQSEKFSVTSMYVGEKQQNNQTTGELAVIYTVKEKKAKQDLDSEHIIPDTVTIAGEHVKTDVIEQDVEYEFESDFCLDYNNDETDRALINQNRTLPRFGNMTQLLRRAGMSLQNLSYSIDYKNINGVHNMFKGIKVGTLGMFARDDQDGQLVGLSNNHVLTPDFVVASLQGNNTVNYMNNTIICPADDQTILGTPVTVGYMTLNERTLADDVEYKLGEVKRSWALQRLNNEIDAAVCSVTIDMGMDSRSRAIKYSKWSPSKSDSFVPVGMNIDYSMEWATSSEIDALVIGLNSKLFKSGYKTGSVGHPISVSGKPCELYMSGAYFSSFVSSKQFKNIIQYKGRDGIDPSGGGDSGSPVCAEINGVWKLIGIHFAGGQDRKTGEHHGLACRIDKIASKLKISRWDGENVASNSQDNFSSEPEPKYAVFNGWRSEPTIIIDGKTYYQAGRTSEDVSHTIDGNGDISALDS